MSNSTDEKIGRLLALTETQGETLAQVAEKVDKILVHGIGKCQEHNAKIKRLEKIVIVVVLVLLGGVGAEKLLTVLF